MTKFFLVYGNVFQVKEKYILSISKTEERSCVHSNTKKMQKSYSILQRLKKEGKDIKDRKEVMFGNSLACTLMKAFNLNQITLLH